MNQVSPRRRATRVFASIAASAALVLGTVGLTAPAQANVGSSTATFIPPANGLVGVPVMITVQLVNGSLAPGSTQTLTVTPVGANSGNAPAITVTNVPVNGTNFTFKFVPPHVDSYTFEAQGVSSSTSPPFSVQPVTVTVTVSAPNTVKVGVAASVTATVTPQNGSLLTPTGQIQFATVGGGNIGGPVILSQQNPSTASFQWTPAAVGQVQFIATYTPGNINGTSDVTCANNGCISPPDTVQVTTSGVNVYLNNPPQFYVGTPGTITATVSAQPPNGSAIFTVNGQVIASNVAVGPNGTVSTTWTPSAAGSFTIAVAWTGNSGVRGSSSEVINVGNAAPAQDRIVLTQAGGGAWANGGTYPVANGSQISFAATTASGSGVTLTAAGPCTVNGLSVTANQGSGSCILTASSPGGNTYSPGTSSYTIQLVPGRQVANVNPRPSGRIAVGKRVTLEGPGNNDTNAGQNMNWRVTSGRAVCKLIYPSNGAVRLQMVKRGSCNVRATAPAVPGQWNRLVLNRSYRSN